MGSDKCERHGTHENLALQDIQTITKPPNRAFHYVKTSSQNCQNHQLSVLPQHKAYFNVLTRIIRSTGHTCSSQQAGIDHKLKGEDTPKLFTYLTPSMILNINKEELPHGQ